MQAIEKGSVESCREAHTDWLAKAQALLEGPQARGPSLDHLAGPLASYAGSVQVSLSCRSMYANSTTGNIHKWPSLPETLRQSHTLKQPSSLLPFHLVTVSSHVTS